VPTNRYLRVITFTATGPEAVVDAALRDVVVPELLGLREIGDAWVGRSGPDAPHLRVLATTWLDVPPIAGGPERAADLAALDAPALGGGAGVAGSGAGGAGGADGAGGATIERIEQVGLAIHARFDGSEPARILRIFRGRARPGELDAYVAEARAGMWMDGEGNGGLLAFALGTEPPDAILTVSAWSGWAEIEAATGGTTQAPIATRNAGRLASFTVDHLEILPETPERNARVVDQAGEARSRAAEART
jgi:hypothetical protein